MRRATDSVYHDPDDRREYEPAECHFCGDRAAWVVHDGPDDSMLVCDDHKTAAFS